MNVIEVISKCEELLEVESTRESLLECFNIVENELAFEYFPLYATHICQSDTVYYTEFEYSPVRIVGCNCAFKLYPQYMQSKEIIKEIKYTYEPSNKSLRDECSYGDEFLLCLTYGIISEYLLSQGFYEEAAVWDNKYKKEIKFLMI